VPHTGQTRIASLTARRVLDGAGLPALEAEVRLANGAVGRAIVTTAAGDEPPAAGHEHLVDGGVAFGGRGLDRALALLTDEIAAAVAGLDAVDLGGLDRRLATLLAGGGRGPVLQRPGGNATLAVSLAVSRAAARSRGLPLWRSFAGPAPQRVPLPMIDVIEADPRELGCRRISILPVGAGTLADALDWSSEVVRAAGEALSRSGLPPQVSPRGAWRSAFEELQLAIDCVLGAIERAGFAPGDDFALGLDVSAGAFGSGGAYMIAGTGERLDTRGIIGRTHGLLRRAPIAVLVDPLAPDAGAGWPELTRTAGQGTAVVMREAVAGSPVRIAQAAEAGAATGASIPPGRLPTVSAIVAAGAAAKASNWATILEAGAAESEDDWLAEIAVALGADVLAAGGLDGAGRTGKWNTLLRLADALPEGGRLGPARFGG
jgi:enolase